MAIYGCNLFIPLLEIDAAQYAEMSREMLQSNNWLHLYDLGVDYLDKPPFLIWISALSMKMFGIHAWAYKLPSLLFAVGSLYSLYRFALLFYNRNIAEAAALIFGSCQAMFLITNDVKTDTILLSFVITAFWQIASWLYGPSKLGWLWGALCIGGAMITKGPIGLLIIGFGFLPHFIINKQWKNFFRWQYIPVLIIIGLVLLPMSIGLYEQFDLHPEKKVNGEYGVSGLSFYYWTQSFGRITGHSTWNNNAGFPFLYENLLWGLIPFTLFFVAATFKGFIKLYKRDSQTEWISTSAVLLGYISLGLSNFQLPHYIYVVLPFICLLVSRYYISIIKYFHHKFRILRIVHLCLFGIGFILFPALLYWIFPSFSFLQYCLACLCVIGGIYTLIQEKKRNITLLSATIFLMLLLNVQLIFIFYPKLFNYQQENQLAKQVQLLNIPPTKLASFKYPIRRNLDFLLQEDIPTIKLNKLSTYSYAITGNKGLKELNRKKYTYTILYKNEAYHISKLRAAFLNPATRPKQTKTYYLLKMH